MPRRKADKRFTFFQEANGDDWKTEIDGNTITVCDAGIQDYVNLPGGLAELDIVFSVKQPEAEGWFALEPQLNKHGHEKVGIVTDRKLSWYSSARGIMEHMYNEGFKFIHLEYIK